MDNTLYWSICEVFPRVAADDPKNIPRTALGSVPSVNHHLYVEKEREIGGAREKEGGCRE